MMEPTACTLKHLRVFTVINGLSYYGGVDFTGLELPETEAKKSDDEEQRTYKCGNCLKHFDGSESFDEAKNHLGTFGSWTAAPGAAGAAFPTKSGGVS